MTLTEMKNLPRDYLIPAEVASILGCDPQYIRVAARQEPQRLGFPVIVVGHRVKIPRLSFLRYMGLLGKDSAVWQG